MRDSVPTPTPRSANAFPSVLRMADNAPVQKVARKWDNQKAKQKNSSTSPSKAPSPLVNGTALLKPKHMYEAELASAQKSSKEAASYAQIKKGSSLLTKSPKPAKPTPLQSAIHKRFTTPEERTGFHNTLLKPKTYTGRPKTVQEQQRLKEIHNDRIELAVKRLKDRFNMIKRSLDRFTMAHVLSNGDLSEKMRILGELEGSKSNPTKRLVSKRREEMALERLLGSQR
jgi:hypothetical protein